MKTEEQMNEMVGKIRTILDRLVTLQESLPPMHPAVAFAELNYQTLQSTMAGVAWASGLIDREEMPSKGYVTVEMFLESTEKFIADAYSNCPR